MAMMITNFNSVVDQSPRKKKRKLQSQLQLQETDHAKWNTEKQQQIYSSKLIQALTHVRLNQTGRRDDKAVREAAYRALAVSAKGRTRWSLAILTKRGNIKLKFRKQQRQNQKRQQRLISLANATSFRSKKSKFSVLKLTSKTLPSVERKVKVLGRLVPGCKQETLPVILEEATDYIAALEMQVRAMTALADFLSASASTSASATAPPSTS